MSTTERLTNHSPVVVYHTPEAKEPKKGSIVMTHGLEGTAWQRHHSDGLWHSSTGQVSTWSELFLRHSGTRGVSLILDSDGGADAEPAQDEGNRIRITGYFLATEPEGVTFEDHVEKLKPLITGLLRSIGLVEVKVLDLEVEDANPEDG